MWWSARFDQQVRAGGYMLSNSNNTSNLMLLHIELTGQSQWSIGFVK